MLTTAEVKAHLRIEHDDEDIYIDTLRDAAYSFAENYTGRTILDTSKIDYLDNFESEIELKHTPVQSITTITYYDTDGAQQSQADFYLNTRDLKATLTPLQDESWPETNLDYENVVITYQAGYATIPDQINQAVLMIITDLYEHRGDITTGVSINTGDVIPALLSIYRIVSV